MPSHITVVPDDPSWRDAAILLARRLQLDHADQRPAHGLVLILGASGLCLADAGSPREQPLQVDFVGGPMGYRQRQGFRRDDLLPRAVGIKAGVRPTLLDATAGLGRDAFMLAGMGCPVTLHERHPVVHALLDDGLRRARSEPRLAETLARMQLLALDSLAGGFSSAEADFDVIYLDPMFPERSKTALVKKPMRLFHALVGTDADADQLLGMALPMARKRVVVKRPLYAPPLAGLAPDLDYKGKAVRFDVYLAPRPSC